MLSIQKTLQTEFKREYLYRMTFDPTMIPRIRKALFSGAQDVTSTFNIDAGEEIEIDLDYLNTEAVFPDKKSEIETLFWKGRNVRFIKYTDTSGDGDFIFFDDENGNAESIFTILYNESAYNNDSLSYIGDIYIDEYDVDKWSIVRTAILKSCHLTDIKHGSRKKGSNEVSYITIHLTWDFSLVDNIAHNTFIEEVSEADPDAK